MKKRLQYNQLLQQLNHKNALVITGMRQVGKTTLMKQIYEEVNNPKLWFDFDNPLDLLYFENTDYDAIYSELSKEAGGSEQKLFVFIDEIQNYPQITKIIKYHIDKFNVKYIVTGSSNYYLKNLFPESLSGRKFLFILNPMSFKEYLYFKDKIEEPDQNSNPAEIKPDSTLISFKKYETEYLDFLQYGGFPEVVVTKDANTKNMILRNIFASFFEKDIRILSDIKDIRELRDLILLLVPRIGNMLDVTKISSELGINRPKIYSYLELLQGVFFLKLIPKFSASIDKSIAGGRKVYFNDTGLLNTIGKVNDAQLFENAVAVQLSEYGNLSFYNKRNSSEIDFILNNETAFEVKLNATEKDLNKLKKICESIGIKKYFLVSKNFTKADYTIFPAYL